LKARRLALVLGAAFVILAAWLITAHPGLEMTMTARNGTKVWSDAGDHGALIKTLAAGEKLAVARCVDSKSFFDYQVRLPDGRLGYVDVNNIDVEMKRPAYLFWIQDPIDACS
jgi:hypothetical protein